MIKLFDEFINEATKYNVHDLEEEDEDYMGSFARYYISKSKCTLEEYIEAGKLWAEDAHDNGEIDDDKYEDAIDHYNNFEYDD